MNDGIDGIRDSLDSPGIEYFVLHFTLHGNGSVECTWSLNGGPLRHAEDSPINFDRVADELGLLKKLPRRCRGKRNRKKSD